MDFKINLSLKSFNPSTVDFYRCVLQEYSNPDSSIKNHIRIPDSNEILQVILKEFEELQKPDTLSGILKILELSIQQTSTTGTNILEFMGNLFHNRALNESDQMIALQIAYLVLDALPNEYPIKSEATEQFSKKHPSKNIKLQTQLALCRSLLIDKFQVDSLLKIVWTQILTEETYDLLVHYIDSLTTKHHVFELPECWQLLEKLFASDNRDDRRLSIFLIRKYLKHCECSPKLVTSWCTYITILENLEEKQSHLILPSLETLQNLTLNDPWVPILIRQILKHNNTLVLRWMVNYLFGDFRNSVLRCNILREFLVATNNTWLWNENYIDNFELLSLDEDDQQKFLENFAYISWKSVPMHAWLIRMKAVQWKSMESKLIINVSMSLRQLQNRQIRTECRNLFITTFKPHINIMSLNDYINFLDAFYSSVDQLSDELLHELVKKIQSSSQPFISHTLFAILRNRESLRSCEQILMNAFSKLCAEEHQWFAILVVFHFQDSEEKQKFCLKYYGIYLPSNSKHLVGSCSMLEETMDEFVTKLSWDDISKAVVRKATVDWFSRLPNYVNADNFEKFLDSGGVTTFVNLINAHERNFHINSAMLDRFITEFKFLVKNFVNIERIVPTLITTANKYDPSLLYKYANEILDIDETNNLLAFNVFKSALELCNFNNEEARQLLIRGLLFGESLSGDSRLEGEYLSMQKLTQQNKGESTHEVRQICLQFLKNLDIDSIEFLKKDLIEKSKKLSLKKPRYFENSKHHRLKLRIAQALSALNQAKPIWDDYYLSAILEENNQTNVTYIYEFIVAMTISESFLTHQLNDLKNLSVSCQVSIFAISYLFTLHHRSNDDFVKKLISFLMPWTMGANFSTRLFAQITIHHLLKNYQLNGFEYLRNAIQSSLEECPNAVEKLETDLRYNFPSELCFLDTNPILYVTIVPEDEHRSSDLEYLSKYKKLEASRILNLSKRESMKQKENDVKKPIIEDVQRKMNPQISLFDNQPIKSKVVTSEMVVVASLIDKLPNLGGIARTCEVLGVGNLVLDSTKHAQNKDFKNLSMTAEKWIQISEVKPSGLREFLVRKRAEGYSIVGAEQTAKSINFMEFKFPKKCILLLGHEKEGIPADLIALLDFAVEIPQYGMVRSLNVHVTGALFIYEYCKQHLMKQSK